MSFDKKTFMKTVTVIYDTREQQNKHIIDKLGECGVMTEKRKLDFGDYSFMAEGRDFSLSCAVGARRMSTRYITTLCRTGHA